MVPAATTALDGADGSGDGADGTGTTAPDASRGTQMHTKRLLGIQGGNL